MEKATSMMVTMLQKQKQHRMWHIWKQLSVYLVELWFFYNKQEGGHKRIDFDDGKMTECAYGTDDDEKVNVDIVETGATQF